MGFGVEVRGAGGRIWMERERGLDQEFRQSRERRQCGLSLLMRERRAWKRFSLLLWWDLEDLERVERVEGLRVLVLVSDLVAEWDCDWED